MAIHRHPLSSSRWVARSSSGSQVARRLPGRHSSVAASRCAAGLDFLFGAVPQEDRHLGALKEVFCPQALGEDTSELMWISVKRVGTRRINNSLAP